MIEVEREERMVPARPKLRPPDFRDPGVVKKFWQRQAEALEREEVKRWAEVVERLPNPQFDIMA